jgi:hypothetical protein
VVRPRVVPKVPHLARLIAAAQLKLGRDVALLAVACKVSRAIRKNINKSSRESVKMQKNVWRMSPRDKGA